MAYHSCDQNALKSETLNVLISILSGANLDAQSSSGRTPLLEATMNGSFDCAETLVAAGANVDLLDLKGTSVLHFLCFNRTTTGLIKSYSPTSRTSDF